MNQPADVNAPTAADFLTKIIIGQDLLDLLGDSIRIEFGGHCNHLLNAEPRVPREGQRGAGLRLAPGGILRGRFQTRGLGSEWISR